jgi:hypothetical protein
MREVNPFPLRSARVDHGIDLGAFLLAFAVALIGAKVFGALAERVGQPAVLGELVAGIVLGPSLLGLVPLSAGIYLLAEIGVLLLLFEVGLETDLEELLAVGGPALAVALAGMLLPFAGGWAVTRALGYGGLAAIFVGAALTATSIGITARVLAELGSLKTREGQVILGAAVADDVLGLIVLVIVTRIAESGSLDARVALRSGALAVGFVVVALVAGGPVGRRLVHVVGKSSARGMLGAASVAFAMLVAWLAKKSESAPIVGAFAAGIALARTNRRHDIDAAPQAGRRHLRADLLRLGGCAGGREASQSVRGGEPLGAPPRAGAHRGRLPRQVPRRVLRVGKAAARVHRRGHGAARRGRSDLRVHGSSDRRNAAVDLRRRCCWRSF